MGEWLRANPGAQDWLYQCHPELSFYALTGGVGLATKAILANRRYIPALSTWPDKDFRDLHPVKGYRLPGSGSDAASRGVGLVVVLRAPSPGRRTINGVDLTYRVDAKRYRARIRSSFAVCSYPGSKAPGPCKPPQA